MTKTKLKTIAAAAILALAAPVTAAENDGNPTGAFFGAGAAFAKLKCPVATITCDKTKDTVPYLYFGGMLSENFGAEVGYLTKTEFNISRLTIIGGGIGVPFIPITERGKLEYTSVHFALIGRVPFGDNVAAFGKLGVNRAHASISGNIGASVASDTGLMYGGGLEVSSGNIAGRLEYNAVDKHLKYGGLSIIYRFR